MATEAFAVFTEYKFASNARKVLGEITAYADKAALSMDRYAASLKAVNSASRGMAQRQRAIQRAFAGMDRSATAASVGIDKAYARIDAGAMGAATGVSASSRRMVASLSTVTAAARGAAGAVTSLKRSGAAGVGAGAGASGAAGHGVSVADAAGLGSAALLAVGIKSAAGIQQSAAQSGVAMGLSTDTVQKLFEPVAMRMSNMTAQSATQSMSLLNVMATSGLNDPKDLLRNNGALPMDIARFADTQFLGKHPVAFDESATQAVKVAHQFGARTSTELKPILNTLFKISQDMPDSLRTAATQLKYYAGTYVNEAKVSPQEVLMLQATADRMGLGSGKSGTGFNMIYRSMLKPTSKAAEAAQISLGLRDAKGNSLFIDKATGKFNDEALFAHLNALYHSSGKAGNVRGFEAELQHAMPSNAALIASTMSSDAGRKQYKAVQATMKRIPDLEKAQSQLMDTLNGQFTRLITNVSNFAAVLAGPLIRPLTDFLTKTGDFVGHATDFLRAHPVASHVATAGLVAGAGLGLYTLLKMMGGITHAVAHFSAHHAGVGVAARFGSRAAIGAGIAGAAVTAGKVGGFAMKATGLSVFGEIGRAFRGIMPLARLFAMHLGLLKTGMLSTREATFAFARILGGMGLKFIPVIGEIIMLVQTIQFLGAHSKDIGKGLAYAAHWITHSAGPMLYDAIKNAMQFVINGIKDTFASVFSGGKGGFFNWVKGVAGSAAKSAQEGISAYNDTQRQLDAKDSAERFPPSHAAKPVAASALSAGGIPFATNPLAVPTMDFSGSTVNITANNPKEVGAGIMRHASTSSNKGGVNSRSTPHSAPANGMPVGASVGG